MMGKEIDTEFYDLIRRVMRNRIGLLPPYSEDGDEAEKDVSDYAEFYITRIDMSLAATVGYLAAIESFNQSGIDSEDAVMRLREARRRYATAFPFCDDDVEGLAKDDARPYVDAMVQDYRKVASIPSSETLLHEYLDKLNVMAQIVHSENGHDDAS